VIQRFDARSRLAKPRWQGAGGPGASARGTLSLAKQAEAQRDLEVKKRSTWKSPRSSRRKLIRPMTFRPTSCSSKSSPNRSACKQVEKEGQVKVQEAEINRREKELIATVLKGAEIERNASKPWRRPRSSA